MSEEFKREKFKPEIKKEGRLDWVTKKEILDNVNWSQEVLESLLSLELKEKMPDSDIKNHKKLEEALSSHFKEVGKQVTNDNYGDQFFKEMGFDTKDEKEAKMKFELWTDIKSRLSTGKIDPDVEKYIIGKINKYDRQVINSNWVRKSQLMELQQLKKEGVKQPKESIDKSKLE